MEEKDEQVVEETTTKNQQDPGDENVVKVKIKDTQENDNVIKVNLDKPPTPKEEKNETKEDNADKKKYNRKQKHKKLQY